MNKPKIYVFDIEATNLAADIGFVICVGIQDVETGKHWMYRIDRTKEWKTEKWNDGGVVKKAIERLSEADIIVAHFGKWFDVPYLRTRALVHGLPDLPPLPLIDTWRVLKNNLKLHNNRLQTLIDLLGKKDKTVLKLPIWTKAAAGDRESIEYIVDHCRVDVEELAECYKEIRHLVLDHPNVALLSKENPGDQCPACGSNKLQKRGWHIARTRRRRRYHCQKCGHWSRGKSEKVIGVDVS